MFLSLTKKVNQWLGSFLLKQGIRARFALSNGVTRDSTSLDAALFLPLAMRLIALEAHEEGKHAVNEALKDSSDVHTTETLGALRVQVLESYVRPALVPNETWSDINRWRFHHRLLKWLRKEFLLAKHMDHLKAAFIAYPAIRQSPQLSSSVKPLPAMSSLLSASLPFDMNSKTSDEAPSTKLPSASIVRDALDMRDWTNKKNHQATGQEMARISKLLGGQRIELYGGALRFADVPQDADVSKLSLQELLEVAGSHVAHCGPLNALCEHADVYQLWTREYVEALGTYLLKRTAAFGGETVILEVGAGDGLLSASLVEFFEYSQRPESRARTHQVGHRAQTSRSAGATLKIPLLVATDDKSWRVGTKGDVRTMTALDTVKAYTASDRWQVIVLCSWMPMSEDWTSIFREYEVDEYILIGECDDGQCGDNWKTWGNSHFLDSPDDEPQPSPSSSDKAAPFKRDGYTRKDMDSIAPLQFSRYDCSISKYGRTVSFRKKRGRS
jgi:hypothetical protein